MITCVRASASRPSSSLHASHQRPVIPRLLLCVWILLAIPSVVAASVLPADARSELNALRSLPSVSPSDKELVHDDLEDVSHSPQERAQWNHVLRRDVTLELDPSLSDMAASLPILVASDDHDRTGGGELSSLVGRANSKDMPEPFDTSTRTNFTSSTCETFVNDFLSNSTFTNCHAMSMLLRNSHSFFQTVRSATALSHVLDISCSADADQCSAYMTDLAGRLLKKDACGEDYEEGNTIVTDAYTNMVAYEPIYRATCLKNPKTSDYCFVDAATSSDNSADYGVYFIPFDDAITSAPYPTCNKCLQASMDLFAKFAEKDGQFLVRSYLPSAQGVNSKCGSDFANVNITVGEDKLLSSAASWTAGRPGLSLQYIVALCLAVIFLGSL
ncbi:hypothetical protein P170DRAFT_479679 [Aspergillus steynii IBT 23096]|uniref:DUF7729 domain-containing protein n=1 Tax=Aspergillus steynii IBT 23096 TaxID=1392250 RepID=A0A2I2FX57_9EURO|nr:uncharacterized protein P170DRAFT_479679 [Aspergillus steynii IBT 23096]PLB45156.1 hypothetical protein P170DRAFT_479679 [Aspergillus steynii IBT 23096]